MIPTYRNRGTALRSAWCMTARAIAAGAMLALAGCAAADGDLPSDTGPDSGHPTQQPAEIVLTPAAPVPAAPVATDPVAAGPAIIPPGETEPAVARAPEIEIDSNPRRLVGLDQSGLTALLGAPMFRRRDAPAELWRYRTRACILDLFLYRPGEGAGAGAPLTVHHYRARTPENGTLAAASCLEALLRARLTGKPG